MEFKGVKGDKAYTLTVKKGNVVSILVEILNTCHREFYQRGPVKLGLIIDEAIFENAVMAICGKNLVSWMEVYDAIWDDRTFGQELQQKIFEKHFN